MPCIMTWICTALGWANLLGSFGCDGWFRVGRSTGNLCRFDISPLTLGTSLLDSSGPLTSMALWNSMEFCQSWIKSLLAMDSRFFRPDIEVSMIIVLSMLVPLKILNVATFQD